MTISGFRLKFSKVQVDETDTSQIRTLKGSSLPPLQRRAWVLKQSGRVDKLRTAGSRLVFFHLEDGRASVQGMVNYLDVQEKGVTASDMRRFYRLMRRGDWYCPYP